MHLSRAARRVFRIAQTLGRIHFLVMRRLRDIRSPSTAASQLRSSRRAPLGAGERFNASQAAMLKSLRAVRPLAAGATAVYFHQPLAEFGNLFNHGSMRNQYSVSKSMRVGRGGSVAQGCCLTPHSSGPEYRPLNASLGGIQFLVMRRSARQPITWHCDEPVALFAVGASRRSRASQR